MPAERNKPLVVGLIGLIGSGKDTAADYLVDNMGFRRISFAGALKDAVAAVFGWDRELLEGRTKQAREWREQVDQWWAQRLGLPKLTPRWVLQYWGTEVCRHGFHDDLWVACVENRLRQTDTNVVITDCRFPNEIAAIKNQNGIVANICRGKNPSWYDTALRANAGDKQALKYMNEHVHKSEWAWVGTKFDAVVDNNGSIEELHVQIKSLVQSQLASTEA